MSAVHDLSDHCFVETTDMLVAISQLFSEEVGRLPTSRELCELLTAGFQGCSTRIFEDGSAHLVQEVSLRMPKAKHKKLVPGDVFVVPTERGLGYIGVFITQNRFGCAYGFFRGVCRIRSLNLLHDTLEPLGYPIYSGSRAAEFGDWYLLGNYPELLKHFDTDPELFHSKKLSPHSERIGKNGSAEKASGELRDLSEEEAAKFGVLDKKFRPIVSESILAKYLAEREASIEKG